MYPDNLTGHWVMSLLSQALQGDDRAWVPIDNPLAIRGSAYTSLSILELSFRPFSAPWWLLALATRMLGDRDEASDVATATWMVSQRT